MSLTSQELRSLLLHMWEDSLYPMSQDDTLIYRAARLKDMDGRKMPRLSMWPKNIRRMLFKTRVPFSTKETYQLFIFLVGNGYSPLLAGTWILSCYGLFIWKKIDSYPRVRITQICTIHADILSKKQYMYYWDIRENCKSSDEN